MSWPVEPIVPSVASNRRITTRASVDLPQPGLPHQAERLAGIDLQVDAVDRVHVADVVLEQDALR